jgi:uncharacterized membrane protein YwzB
MPGLIGLLVVLLVFCLIYWAATRIMAAFGVGEPVHTVVIVVLVLIAVVYLLRMFHVDVGF